MANSILSAKVMQSEAAALAWVEARVGQKVRFARIAGVSTGSAR